MEQEHDRRQSKKQVESEGESLCKVVVEVVLESHHGRLVSLALANLLSVEARDSWQRRKMLLRRVALGAASGMASAIPLLLSHTILETSSLSWFSGTRYSCLLTL